MSVVIVRWRTKAWRFGRNADFLRRRVAIDPDCIVMSLEIDRSFRMGSESVASAEAMEAVTAIALDAKRTLARLRLDLFSLGPPRRTSCCCFFSPNGLRLRSSGPHAASRLEEFENGLSDHFEWGRPTTRSKTTMTLLGSMMNLGKSFCRGGIWTGRRRRLHVAAWRSLNEQIRPQAHRFAKRKSPLDRGNTRFDSGLCVGIEVNAQARSVCATRLQSAD